MHGILQNNKSLPSAHVYDAHLGNDCVSAQFHRGCAHGCDIPLYLHREYDRGACHRVYADDYAQRFDVYADDCVSL